LVEDFIYDNREYFSGVSLLPASGDKDYPQAPFTTIYTSKELSKMYGSASHFASGLIVDGLQAFDDNLWKACDCVIGIGEKLLEDMEEPKFPQRIKKNGYTDREYTKKMIQFAKDVEEYYIKQDEYDTWWRKKDWIRRVVQFSERYFKGDLKESTYCLKDVSNLKLWEDLNREYKEIDWSQVIEENPYYQEVDTMAAQACSGGKCEVSF